MANLIVVGGPISVGKSTLAASLGLPQVPELNENDIIQELMLENTYSKGRVSAEVIEYFFLEIRRKKYIEFSSHLQTNVLDRSIFESLWFAQGNMDSSSYAYFKKLWKDMIVDLIEKYGKPKLYILLTMEWETFVERLFNRGREVEVINFKKNEEFFRKHIKEYEDHMVEIFNEFGLNYVKIATDNINVDEVAEIAKIKVSEVLNA